MAKVGLIYGQIGAGKTVNGCRVNVKERGKNLLLCTDYSGVVLDNFPEIKKSVDVENVNHWCKKNVAGQAQDNFIEQFEKAVESGKYDTIIVDNLTGLFDMAIIELAEFPKHDFRQDYQRVYQELKRLVRLANQVDCDVLFTTWEMLEDTITSTGELVKRTRPHLQQKILDPVCGLCQVVGKVNHTEDGRYYYDYRGSVSMYAKDQLYLRKTGLPENIFDGLDRKDNA